jgi:hypothetical protein
MSRAHTEFEKHLAAACRAYSSDEAHGDARIRERVEIVIEAWGCGFWDTLHQAGILLDIPSWNLAVALSKLAKAEPSLDSLVSELPEFFAHHRILAPRIYDPSNKSLLGQEWQRQHFTSYRVLNAIYEWRDACARERKEAPHTCLDRIQRREKRRLAAEAETEAAGKPLQKRKALSKTKKPPKICKRRQESDSIEQARAAATSAPDLDDFDNLDDFDSPLAFDDSPPLSPISEAPRPDEGDSDTSNFLFLDVDDTVRSRDFPPSPENMNFRQLCEDQRWRPLVEQLLKSRKERNALEVEAHNRLRSTRSRVEVAKKDIAQSLSEGLAQHREALELEQNVRTWKQKIRDEHAEFMRQGSKTAAAETDIVVTACAESACNQEIASLESKIRHWTAALEELKEAREALDAAEAAAAEARANVEADEENCKTFGSLLSGLNNPLLVGLAEDELLRSRND